MVPLAVFFSTFQGWTTLDNTWSRIRVHWHTWVLPAYEFMLLRIQRVSSFSLHALFCCPASCNSKLLWGSRPCSIPFMRNLGKHHLVHPPCSVQYSQPGCLHRHEQWRPPRGAGSMQLGLPSLSFTGRQLLGTKHWQDNPRQVQRKMLFRL